MSKQGFRGKPNGQGNQANRQAGGNHAGSRRSGQRVSASAAGAARERNAQTPAAVADRLDLPVEKNGEYIADIVGLGHDGEGVGRVNGFTLFVHGALPGEKARIKVMKLKKQFGYAKLLEVLEASPDRVEPPCTIYKQCGGCQLQHLSYEAQLRLKRQTVVDSLERIGKLAVAPADDRMSSADVASSGIVVHPTLGMRDPWRYRNKAQVPIGQEEGGLIGGFYAQGSHRIVDMDACLIQHEQTDAVVREVKRIAYALGITAYDEESHQGLLRHVVVKIGFRTGDIMVVLVTNGSRIPGEEQLVERIREAIPAVRSICHNVNTQRTNVIFGDKTSVLWGQEVIHDYIGDVQFAISARSFYQVNPVQTEVLYGKALEYAGLTGSETVIDAYCGIGTISLFLARHARHVYGVEIVAEAIADARANAELNGLGNVTFAVGKAEEVIPAWREDGITPEVVVVDPPRKGCDEVLLETLLAMQPERIVYVSCNPATLARDLRVLEDGGYSAVEVQPVDMFPWTTHVECCVSVVRE
ncbi:23S rRNA (uracil(1939)-C(5))-methyltransferase RlmD [Paenibacillus contaminans]|uniref:23S rRNA (Uracil(1939)-C(5))-methyltransferase RlmD n=1 Tax=Paenibacillus contaminans TaxID=450362 RepID=A0A329M2A2_9BACL|nr:23S rRNA (uracil(1939)-C(5))-methyltransferase RlmD [Paenibacillus contaminans]RAV14191.1 23S rRNA (uracil(1939)-C(5))-methyltransferase RlmD [Paenibacillus contaminans]